MKIIIAEFKEKVREINEYFSFIEITTSLKGKFGTTKTIKVSQKVHNILKSNLFLLLYNLIESSFKSALEKICLEITSNQVEYKDVIPEIKQMWIKKEYKNFEKSSLPQNVEQPKFIMDKIDDIANDVIKIEFTIKRNRDISGNLDTIAIKKINKKYGIILNEEPKKYTQSVSTIKTNRNKLAHGDETFNRCGADYTMQDLKEIKNNSINYMEFILPRIKIYLDNKKYKIEKI